MFVNDVIMIVLYVVITLQACQGASLDITNYNSNDDVMHDYDVTETDGDAVQRRNDTRAYREQMVLHHLAENQRHQPCFRSRDAYDRLVDKTGPIPGYDRPLCYEDGTFMPRQCKGYYCHCMAPDGTRLGRYRQQRHRAENMHCLCALDQYGLALLGMRDPFTCGSNGNYRRIQCYHTTCFCTDDRGNVLENIDPVHINLRRNLNCKPRSKSHHVRL